MKKNGFHRNLLHISLITLILLLTWLYVRSHSKPDIEKPSEITRITPSSSAPDGNDAAWNKALEGYKLLEQGDAKKAMECFEESLKMNPDSGKVLNAMGKALVADGELDEALKFFMLAEEKKPGDLENRIETAYIHMIRKDYDKAIKQLDTLPDSVKTDPSVDFTRGFIAANQNKYEEAVIHYNKAIAKNPDYWQYRLYRAFSLIKLGDNLQARKDAQFALSKQPDLITCYLALAEIEWVTGNRNESITAYNKAIELDQKHKPVDVYSQYLHRENPKLGRAIVYWDIGQYGKALADLDEVENSKDNRKSIALLYKALIYRDTGDEKKALEYARKWENSPKEDIDHWNQNDFAISVAECYIILQDKEKAFRLLKRYKPQTNTAYYDRGMMLEQIGRYKEAVEDFSICLKQTQDITHKKEIEQRIRNIKTKISN